MSISRGRMTLLAVLGVSVCGLALDRLVLSPGRVDAAVGAAPGADAGGGLDGVAGGGADGAADAVGGGVAGDAGLGVDGGGDERRGALVAALTALGERVGVDAVRRERLAALFSEPASWSVVDREAAAREAEAFGLEEVALEGLALTGVFTGSEPMAIIIGRAVGVGDAVAGYTVARIDARGVLLAHPSRGGDLRLAMPAGVGGG